MCIIGSGGQDYRMSWLTNGVIEKRDWVEVKVLLFCIVFFVACSGPLPAVDGGEAQRWFKPWG